MPIMPMMSFDWTKIHRALLSVLLVTELLTAKLIFVSDMFSTMRTVTILWCLLLPLLIARRAFACRLTFTWWLVLRVEHFAMTELLQVLPRCRS